MRLQPQISHTIERLIIESHDIKSSNLHILPYLLPKIQNVTFYQDSGDIDGIFQEVQSFHPWKKTIKVIKMFFGHFLASHILCGDICPLLTEIETRILNVCDMENLIKLLKNAPNLKILKLWMCKLNLMNLEALHLNVPLLESLSLVYSEINSDIIPTDIKPTFYMKKLDLKYIETMTTENFINFEKYLANKYPRIVDMVLDIDSNYTREIETCIYRGFTFHIRQIASYLTSLEYKNSEATRFIFPILDRNGCKLKKITITEPLEYYDFRYIIQSNQAQYIQALSCYVDSYSMIIDDINIFTALTELKLSFTALYMGVDVSLSNLMDVIGGNIETVELDNAIISVDESFSFFSRLKELVCSIPTYPRLKKLKFTKSTLLKNVDIFISRSVPNLREFILDKCDWDFDLNLGSTRLSNLLIETSLPPKRNHILITTTENNEKRWYTSKKVSKMNIDLPIDFRNRPAVKSLPFDQYNGNPYKTFVIKSLGNLLLINTRS